MTYSEKLRDPRWQKRRLEVLERDGWKCTACGDASKTLHVHHRYYVSDRDPWFYPPWALQSLCEECHDEAKGTGAEFMAGFEAIIACISGNGTESEIEDLMCHVDHTMTESKMEPLELLSKLKIFLNEVSWAEK